MAAAASAEKRPTVRSLSTDVKRALVLLERVDQRVQQLDQRVEQLDQRVEQLDQRVEQLDERVEQLDERQQQLDEGQRGTMVLLEHMDERNQATIEAVFSVRDQLQQEIRQTKAALEQRLDVLEMAVRGLSLEVRRHGELLK